MLADIEAALEPFRSERAVALRVGFPSFGDYDQGILESELSAFPSMHGFHLKDYLEQRWKLPTRVIADGNLFALGIAHFGEGRAHPDFLAISLGTGTAIGIVRGGNVLGGPRGFPEPTMRFYTEWGWPSAWDHSGYHFSELYGADPVTMSRRASEGDTQALAVFARVGRALAATIRRLARETDMRVVIIGGGLAEVYAFFRPALEDGLKDSGVVAAKTALPKPALLGARALFISGRAR